MTEFKKLRKERGLTTLAAAKLLGVSHRTAQRWDNGETKTPEMAIRLLSLVE